MTLFRHLHQHMPPVPFAYQVAHRVTLVARQVAQVAQVVRVHVQVGNQAVVRLANRASL